jgi:hypothetical protein
MKARLRIGLVASLLPVLLVACGEADQGANPPSQPAVVQGKDIKACELLTGDEIEAALGWKVATAEGKDFGATGTCTYSSSTPYSTEGFQQLSLVVGHGLSSISSSEAMAKWRFEQYSGESAKNPSLIVKPVDGLGVPAIQNGMAGMFGIEMAVDDMLVTLSPFDSLEPARALAKKVVARVR